MNLSMQATKLSPHLMTSGGAKRRSVSMQPVDSKSQPSLGVAFRMHVEQVHWASEKSGDVNQSSDQIAAGKAFSRTSWPQKMVLTPGLWRGKSSRAEPFVHSESLPTSCPNSRIPPRALHPIAEG
jgi:hypothetical protein